MSEARDPPFFAGSILGLRAWVVQAHLPSAATRLGSTFAEATWEPGRAWTEAVCDAPGERPGRHHAPRQGCSCGLYAYHPDLGIAEQLFGEHVGLWDGPEMEDPCFVEMVGVCGVIEACGRIEVHPAGFRAERARPQALILGRDWPPHARAAVEEIARLYGAELLEAGGPEHVLDHCRERGGALDEGRLAELLGEEALRPDPEPGALVPATPPYTPPPPPPPTPPAPKRAWSGLGDIVWKVVIGIVAVCWYGFWAAVVVSIAGAILFGWFDEDPQRPPAKVLALKIDRERCVIGATVRARRRLGHLDLRLDGNLRNGDPLGEHSFKLGPVERGRSRVVVARPPPWLCRSRHHFTINVRPVWPALVGAPAEATSRFKGAVRNGPRAPTSQGQ